MDGTTRTNRVGTPGTFRAGRNAGATIFAGLRGKAFLAALLAKDSSGRGNEANEKEEEK
jgi:hypothetical protein